MLRILRRSNLHRKIKINKNHRRLSSAVDSPLPPISLPSCPVNELIWNRVDKWPNATALKCSISGETITYSELRNKSKKLASSLFKLGLKREDIVTIMMPNSPAFALSTLGILEAGMRVSFINPTFTEGEILNLLRDSGCKAVITTTTLEAEVLKSTGQITDRLIQLIAVKDKNVDCSPKHYKTVKFEELVENDADLSEFDRLRGCPDLNDSAIMLYSSGTTGLPKGVCLCHRAVASTVLQAMHPDVVSVPEATSDFQPCVPIVLPMFHSYGLLSTTLKTLYAGGMIITIPKFVPQQFLEVLKGNKEVFLHAVPPMVHFLHNYPEVTASHLKSLQLTMVAGSTLSERNFEMLMAKRKHIILNSYGTTETSVVAQSTAKSSSFFSLTLHPNMTVKIISDSGEDQPFGSEGEICFKGPQLMTRYHNNPQATFETIDREGWLHTGDIGCLDENKNLRVGSRIKELIKVKGFQVSPVELEDVIKTIPEVGDVAVIAMDCPKAGERPVAFVVPKGPGVKGQAIESYVSSRVAPYKRISKVIFIDQIPRNPTGKILRRKLKEML